MRFHAWISGGRAMGPRHKNRRLGGIKTEGWGPYQSLYEGGGRPPFGGDSHASENPLSSSFFVFGQPIDTHLGYPFSLFLSHPKALSAHPSHSFLPSYSEISTGNISGNEEGNDPVRWSRICRSAKGRVITGDTA